MTYWAVVRFQFEGIHRYPSAPEDVSFLCNPHRHMFHITVHLQQFHEERDVEYLLFKRWLEDTIPSNLATEAFGGPGAGTCPVELGAMSCETIAARTAHYVNVMFNSTDGEERHRRIKVEVSEDGENGALVELD